MDTSAIMGFMNSLLDVIKRERPDHLAVCFDKGGSVDRVEMFEAYKANRDETPEAIKISGSLHSRDSKSHAHSNYGERVALKLMMLLVPSSKASRKRRVSKPIWLRPIRILHNWSLIIFLCTSLRFGGGYDVWGVPEVLREIWRHKLLYK